MIKKVISLWVIIVISLVILSGCGGNYKIDIGGEIVAGKPMSSCQVRVMLGKNIFNQEDDITIEVGWGFRNDDIRGLIAQGAIIVLTIDAENFSIINEENIESEDLYEKEYKEYSEKKYVCTEKKKRYIPNYYEKFVLRLNSDIEKTSGAIIISITNLMEGRWDGDGDGQTKRIYYATNINKIAFSANSIEDAQKKL